MRRIAIVVTMCALAACGARTALDLRGPDAAAPRDAGRDAPIDAASGAPDAPPVRCPPPSDFGYTLRAGGPLGLGLAIEEISLGGDGTDVVLAVVAARGATRAHLFELDAAAGTARELATVDDATLARASVEGGVARMIAAVPALESEVRIEVRGGVAGPIERTRIFRGPLATSSRPAWNGVDTVIAGTNGFEIFLGAFVAGGDSLAWRSFGPASDVEVAAQADTGTSEVLYRAGDGALRVEAYARDGTRLSEPVLLEGPIFTGRAALGWLEDGTDQQLVLAGFRDDGGWRATLQRYTVGGLAAGGFSAPIAGMPGGVDLTTVAPRGHASGYGMIAGVFGGSSLFHGAGQDFVGDARELPIPCDGEDVSIASGPCGYVLACVAAGDVWLATAVPPRPR